MPIISIAFYMVLIRIAMKRHGMDASIPLAGVTESRSRSIYGTRQLEVHISQFSRSDADPQDRFEKQDTEGGSPLYGKDKEAF